MAWSARLLRKIALGEYHRRQVGKAKSGGMMKLRDHIQTWVRGCHFEQNPEYWEQIQRTVCEQKSKTKPKTWEWVQSKYVWGLHSGDTENWVLKDPTNIRKGRTTNFLWILLELGSKRSKPPPGLMEVVLIRTSFSCHWWELGRLTLCIWDYVPSAFVLILSKCHFLKTLRSCLKHSGFVSTWWWVTEYVRTSSLQEPCSSHLTTAI